jgi:hypothetical protein
MWQIPNKSNKYKYPWKYSTKYMEKINKIYEKKIENMLNASWNTYILIIIIIIIFVHMLFILFIYCFGWCNFTLIVVIVVDTCALFFLFSLCVGGDTMSTSGHWYWCIFIHMLFISFIHFIVLADAISLHYSQLLSERDTCTFLFYFIFSVLGGTPCRQAAIYTDEFIQLLFTHFI